MSQLQLPKLRKIDPNKPKKKKILLLSDDLRMHSGIATMSREFVLGTLKEYDWVQLAAAVKHPNEGQIMDISEDAAKQTGVEDAYLKLYGVSGYGDPNILQQVMNIEKPDAILHFTDPRFWEWLYQIEHSLRQHIPIMYYNIWDDLPYPHWNEPFYESCDLIMNISRQTQNIVKNVLKQFPKPDWAVQWVPHGINENDYRPINSLDRDWNEYSKFADDFKKTHDVDFIVFWNNRNIRRKQPGDVILAFNEFCRQLPADKANRACLLMHTQPVDPNGTDLYAVADAMAPNRKIFFTEDHVNTQQLNFMYNMADVTVNIASNEGFGLSHAESLMAGTPIINNVTGGLQDGCRFEDDNGDWIEFNTNFPSNHTGVYRTHGIWAKPVFPTSRSLQGSPPTPYIFDDRVEYKDVADAIMYWYKMSAEERAMAGLEGREWVIGDESNFSARQMSARFIECINTCLEKWTPKQRFTMYTVPQKQSYKFETVGVL
jgi:glycosyltransferase involved in cell wall biosynthesis